MTPSAGEPAARARPRPPPIARMAYGLRRRFPFLVDLLLFLPVGLLFAARRRRYADKSMEEIFAETYESNIGGDPESRSGFGSSLAATARVRDALPGLIGRIGARSMLDIPCGDFHWMKEVRLGLDRYIGADIVAAMVEENRRRHGGHGREFARLDILADRLPTVELVLCRDLFIHFSNAEVRRAVANLKASGSRFLLTTTFTRVSRNRDIPLGSFRPINLEAPPFSFPRPLEFIDERHEGRLWGRGLGLWRIDDLPGDVCGPRPA